MKKKKPILLTVLLVIVIVAVVFAVLFASEINRGNLREDTAVIVPNGAGTIIVAEALVEHGAIEHPFLFRLYAAVKDYDTRWQAGTFELKAGEGYRYICESLTTVSLPPIRVTFPEGYQIKQMAKLLEEKGVCTADAFLEAAATHTYDYEFLKDINHENPLEGYLFPDTYFYDTDTDPDIIINEMLTNFKVRLYTEDNIKAAEAMGLTFDELIILSSMVSSEATTDEDQKNVAGVFMNRLTNPAYTKLQSCVTVEYAMGVKKSIISYKDTLTDSPYNTYMYPGLPIGPICCPGEEAVNNTVNYAHNNYYYFQSDKNGKLYFAETYQEHASVQKDVQSDWHGEVIENYNE